MLNERGGRQAAGLAGGRGGDQRDLVGRRLGHVLRPDRRERALDRLLALERLGGGLELGHGLLALERGDVADGFALHHHGREEQLVRAVALLAHLAVHQRVGEAGDVAGRLPDLRVHDDRGLKPDDVVAAAHHVVPPAVADVLLQLGPERAVVEEAVEAAVDFGGLENEAAALGERDNVVHRDGGGRGRVGHSLPQMASRPPAVNSLLSRRGNHPGLAGTLRHCGPAAGGQAHRPCSCAP